MGQLCYLQNAVHTLLMVLIQIDNNGKIGERGTEVSCTQDKMQRQVIDVAAPLV